MAQEQTNGNAETKKSGPRFQFSKQEPISYADIVPKDKNPKKRLSAKSRKEAAVIEWHQLITDGSRYLQTCGIKPETIQSYMIEPWNYRSICEAVKWWKKEMLPLIQKLLHIMNNHNEKGWRFLLAHNRSHPQIRELRNAQGRVKEKFWERPRWPQEKGLVLSRGY
jgi:hypothetical protein